ncbi:MAG: sensor histidine kinase [Actinomycetota bacterium]
MTLRLRLTLITTLVLAIVLTAFGIGVYVLLNKTLHDNLDKDIGTYAAQIVGAIDSGEDPASYFGRVDFVAELLDSSGSTLPIQPFNAQDLLPKDAHAIAVAADSTQRPFYRDITVSAVQLRMLVVHVSSPRYDGALLVAEPRASISLTLARLRTLLTAAGIFGLMLAALLAWESAQAALRPVEEVGAAASEIGETGDLSRRVDPTSAGSKDELGKLTIAFNSMLDRLEETQQTLSKTLDSQRRFLADASHELRTPLTTMRGNLEVLRSSPNMSLPDRNDALRDSIEEAERMSKLVEDLLALARADARAPVPNEPVQLSRIVRDSLSVLPADTATVNLDADDSVIVDGSAELLRRLVGNLVDNAIKYTPTDGSIDASVSKENGWAVVRVKDTGIGMTPEELSLAFNRFWRSDRSRGERGSGLGLAIAKAVATDHGGTLEAESQAGVGTTMTVKLPLGVSKDSDQAVIASGS